MPGKAPPRRTGARYERSTGIRPRRHPLKLSLADCREIIKLNCDFSVRVFTKKREPGDPSPLEIAKSNPAIISGSWVVSVWVGIRIRVSVSVGRRICVWIIGTHNPPGSRLRSVVLRSDWPEGRLSVHGRNCDRRFESEREQRFRRNNRWPTAREEYAGDAGNKSSARAYCCSLASGGCSADARAQACCSCDGKRIAAVRSSAASIDQRTFHVEELPIDERQLSQAQAKL
jgi:hypothetical protein